MPKTLDDMVKEAELALSQALSDFEKAERLIEKTDKRWELATTFHLVIVALLLLNLIVALVK